MILVVVGGADYARRVYSTEHRGYWTAALPLVLEKHGLLDFEVRAPNQVDRADLLRSYDCVLIGRLGDEEWSDDFASALLECGRPVLVEAPHPGALVAELGIIDSRPAAGPLRVRCGPELTAAADTFGLPAGGQVIGSRAKRMDRAPELDWRSAAPGLISEACAHAWAQTGWDVERWTVDAATRVLATYRLEPDGERWPAVITRGAMTAIAFSVFGYLGQAHTSEPCAPGEWRSNHRTLGIEGLLLALISEALVTGGATRTRVLPWPGQARWTLNVRHDFDRPIGYREVQKVLQGHRAVGTRATWYWRARHLIRGRPAARRWMSVARSDAASARLVARTDGHEVALHTDRLYPDGETERRTVEQAIRHGVVGTSAHGAPDCFRYQGAPNILWAAKQGMLYTELIQHGHMHPHRFASLAEDGTIEALSVICLPHHVSFDASTTQGSTLAERAVELHDSYFRAGGMFQLMNHPDLHPEELFRTLAQLTREARLDVTAGAAASWWRRTHTAAALSLTSTTKGQVRVSASEEVRGLQLERRAPDGQVRIHRLDLAPSEVVTFMSP